MTDPMNAFVIDVREITKRYDGRAVVDRISMQVRRGEVYGFLGPNGSGKTTFIRMLCGLLKADAGSGSCLGYDIRTESAQIKRHVGYMTQRFSFYEDLTIRENLEFIARIYQINNCAQRVNESLAKLGLESRSHQLAGTLSGGWKQRLALAACMIHEPDLLLLDEPTAGVDPKARRDFWEQIHALAAGGLTVLITTHYMDEAERCHRLAYISYGQLLAAGTPQDIIAQSRLNVWEISGPEVFKLSAKLAAEPGIEQVTAFGTTLHAAGTDSQKLRSAVEPLLKPEFSGRPIKASLEDVFIHLMDSTKEVSG